jgi:hypothetical protein
MGIVERLAAIVAAAARPLIGRATALPPDLVARYPELQAVRWRRGGLPVRVGGWCLGQKTVSGITLWRTIWLAPGAPLSIELLLHEARHVQQFEASAAFPILYLWESVRRGYVRNRFEVDARAYAAARLRETDESKPRG